MSRKNGLFEYRVMPSGYVSKYEIRERRNKIKDALKMVCDHPDTTVGIKKEIIKILKG
jgi:hypothetical protein